MDIWYIIAVQIPYYEPKYYISRKLLYVYKCSDKYIYIIYTQNRLCCRLVETVYVLPPFTDDVSPSPRRHGPCVINGGTDTSYHKSTHKM